MPVPRVGFFASIRGFQGAKSGFSEKSRTFIALKIEAPTLFGASMIGRTITG